jgi:hypothetical protein
MPAEKDLYFPPEDEEFAVRHMASAEAELRVIPGVWAHFAGGGLNHTDRKFIDDALRELLVSWSSELWGSQTTPTGSPSTASEHDRSRAQER